MSMSPVKVVLLALMTISTWEWSLSSLFAFLHRAAISIFVLELIPDVLILVFKVALDDVLQLFTRRASSPLR